LWELINAKFNVDGKPVIFCWGQTIHNPERIKVTRELVEHEKIHGARQGIGPDIEAWWRRYIAEPSFRFQEELPAHRAEYHAFCKRHGSQERRAQYLDCVAAKLASPLYGELVTATEARHAILTYRGEMIDEARVKYRALEAA